MAELQNALLFPMGNLLCITRKKPRKSLITIDINPKQLHVLLITNLYFISITWSWDLCSKSSRVNSDKGNKKKKVLHKKVQCGKLTWGPPVSPLDWSSSCRSFLPSAALCSGYYGSSRWSRTPACSGWQPCRPSTFPSRCCRYRPPLRCWCDWLAP